MKKETKVNFVNELRGALASANLMVVADYRGLSVEKITVLRRNCRKAGARIKVVKNTLVKKAIPGTSFASAGSLFEGPTALAISQGDPVPVIKALTGFSKENETFTIKGGVLDGTAYTSDQLFRIALLPSRDVLLGKMIGSMVSPLRRMVGSLASPLQGLVGVLKSLERARAGA